MPQTLKLLESQQYYKEETLLLNKHDSIIKGAFIQNSVFLDLSAIFIDILWYKCNYYEIC